MESNTYRSEAFSQIWTTLKKGQNPSKSGVGKPRKLHNPHILEFHIYIYICMYVCMHACMYVSMYQLLVLQTFGLQTFKLEACDGLCFREKTVLVFPGPFPGSQGPHPDGTDRSLSQSMVIAIWGLRDVISASFLARLGGWEAETKQPKTKRTRRNVKSFQNEW